MGGLLFYTTTMHISKTEINIRDLRIFARHGVMAEERTVGNEFLVSLTLGYDATEAMATDRIEHALNYAAVIDTVRREMATPSALLEHAAARIAEALLTNYPQITEGRLTLASTHPPVAAQLGATEFSLTFRR